jgi:serine/threonine-protein kinase
MAEVWRAVVTGMAGFHREVVIKTMRPELAVSEDLVRMFINEARIAARLNHPGIMQVFDFGQLDSRYFIAMEFVPGRTLRQLARALRHSGLTLPRRFVVRLLMETARALGYGHALSERGVSLGFAHRDVSPENIMVSIEGSAKLIDFGAAVTRECPPPMNTFVGKYRYLPPERLEGAIGDARADVYSLGIVAYEYLTGQRPYDGPQVKKAILRGDAPDPCRVMPNLPRRLGALIVKATARDPGQRFSDGAELAAELAVLVDRDLGDAESAATEAKVFEILRAEPEAPRTTAPLSPRGRAGATGGDTDVRLRAAVLSLAGVAPVEAGGGGGLGAATAPTPVRSAGVAVVVSDPIDPDGDVVDESAAAGLDGDVEATVGDAVHRSIPELLPPVAGAGAWFGGLAVTPPAGGRETVEGSEETAKGLAERPGEEPSSARGGGGGASPPGPHPAVDDEPTGAAPDSAAACFARGLELVANHHFGEARELWQRAIALDPERQSYRMNLERLERRMALEESSPDTHSHARNFPKPPG